MSYHPTFQLVRFALLMVAVCASSAHAQWNQNASTGPFLYTDPANWTGGTINNTFSTNWTTNMNVYWDADYTLTSTISMSATDGLNVTFRSDSAVARTIKMAGNWARSGGGTMTIGTVANPLILDLNGATRQFGGSSATVNIYAKITNTTGTAGLTLNSGTGYTYLYNNDNDFNGPVTFTRRGGGFSSIKNVGAGASSLGAPTTAANGLITVSDATSFGFFDYTGTGDESNRNFLFNLTSDGAMHIRNVGSGKLTLTGEFEFNNLDRLGVVLASSADLDILGVISEQASALRSIRFGGGGVNTRAITLGSNNTYSGKTTINNVTLVTPSLKNAGTTSSLGDATSANAVIGINNGRLRYTGSGDSTDRVIDLEGTTGGATLEASGSGAIVFTSDFTATGAGTKTLTLGGTNLGLNEIRSAIVNNSATNVTSVTKDGVGRWVFSGTNTYTGATTISGGTLALSGSGSIASSSLTTVASGATLGGTGTVGATRIQTGGFHAPGNSPGIQSISEGLEYESGATLTWELFANDTAGRGANYDGIDLTSGALAIDPAAILALDFGTTAGGSTVNWNNSFWGSDQSWTIVDVQSPATWDGSLFGVLSVGPDASGQSFASLRPNASFSMASVNGDLTLQYIAVPEPSTLALAAGGLATAACSLHRRRGCRSRA